ncbi:hypothetical protein HYW74_01000 [Candidatus Pacearchaeota archaeon]|nr:hypothetical protein [Candidatus Pacearchaeota archaeon]
MVQKRRVAGILSILFVIILILAIYLTFIYAPTCKDIACWEAKLVKCSKAKYLNDAKDISWFYTIKERAGDKCVVNAKALTIKRGLESAMVLEGKNMDCFLPLGVITDPEINPNICHGRLKEEMQTLIIQKLHQYIVSNIGEISQELTGIEAVTGNKTATQINVLTTPTLNSTSVNNTNSSG